MDNYPYQCAWCHRLFDLQGRMSEPLPFLRFDLIHRMCGDCNQRMRLQLERRRAAEPYASVDVPKVA